MALASKLLLAIAPAEPGRNAAPTPALFWQPIRHAGDSSAIFYHEALIRLIDHDFEPRSPAATFLSLERLGLVRVVDHYVISQVLDELEMAPDIVLGVNISARSVVRDKWWDEIKDRLQRAPDLAGRLVIEITETAAIPDVSSAVRLVSDLRRLGCRIAIDDFGTGFSSVRQLLALAPDIVKIDRFFLRRGMACDRQREALRHLIALARSLGATVIVEGVESDEQAEVALEAGGIWQQGYHWGRPAASRSWRFTGGFPDTGKLARTTGGVSGLVTPRNSSPWVEVR